MAAHNHGSSLPWRLGGMCLSVGTVARWSDPVPPGFLDAGRLSRSGAMMLLLSNIMAGGQHG